MLNDVNTTSKLVIGHALYSPWLEILNEGQLKTWLLDQGPNIHHSYGHPVKPVLRNIDVKYWDMKWMNLIGRLVMLGERAINFPLSLINLQIIEKPGFLPKTINWEILTPDLNVLLGNKTIAIFEHFLKSDRNYLVTSTSSSYINLDVLNKLIDKLPDKNVIAGRILQQRETKFASGAFRILSRDVVAYIVDNRKKFDYWLPEDLALGRLLKKCNYIYVSLPSLDIVNQEELQILSEVDLLKTAHFRLKSGTFKKRDDIKLMHELHQRLQELK